MIRLLIAIIFYSTILCSCGSAAETDGRRASQEKAVEDTSRTSIIDVFHEYPYELKKHPRLSPPDSLTEPGISGSVVFAYALNSRGEIVDVQVMKLRLQNQNGQKVADFFDPAMSVGKRENPYPESVEKHLSWLLSYARNVEFQRREGVEVQDTTRFTLLTRIEV